MAVDFSMPDLPLWVVDPRLVRVVTSEAETGMDGGQGVVQQAIDLIEPISRLEKEIRARLNAVLNVEDCAEDCAATMDESYKQYGNLFVRGPPTVCLTRLLVGACCEAYISYKCASIARPGDTPKCNRDSRVMARFYKDACLVATWTSAHAVYMHDLISHYNLSPSPPSIHSVPNESSEFDLSDLYSRRTCPRVIKTKDSSYMLTLMTSCTNPGSRGWDSVVKQSLDKSDGVRRICCNALVVSMTGMNSCIHPAIRLHWTKRLQVANSLLVCLPVNEIAVFAQKCIVEFKEAIRRMVSNCTSSSLATAAALLYLKHPVALLEPCRLGVPCAGLESSSTAFALAGKAFAESMCKADIATCVKNAFSTQSKPACDTEEATQHLIWNPSYLGKGTASVNLAQYTTCTAASTTCTTSTECRLHFADPSEDICCVSFVRSLVSLVQNELHTFLGAQLRIPAQSHTTRQATVPCHT
jgi:hypothetical protein